MNRSIKAITIFLLLAATLLTASCTTQTKQPPTPPQPSPPINANWADYFPLEVGSYWEYDAYTSEFCYPENKPGQVKREITGTQTINGLKFKIETLKSTRGNQDTIYYSEDKNGISFAINDSMNEIMNMNPASPNFNLFLKFPIKIGETWFWRGMYGSLRLNQTTLSYEVKSFETVETPAGKFNAFLIEYRDSPGKDSYRCLSWYAEGVGLVKEEKIYGTAGTVGKLLKKYKIKNNPKPGV